MIAIIKDVCIFVMIAQAIIFFVPGDSYMKYVRILVGILMIWRITEPLFAFVLNEEEQKTMLEHITVLENNIMESQAELNVEDNRMGIYQSIEDEIKNRLSQCQNEQYTVEEVELLGTEQNSFGETEIQSIIVRVRDKQMSAATQEISIQVAPIQLGEEKQEEVIKDTDELKKLYGDCIGVDADRITILQARE